MVDSTVGRPGNCQRGDDFRPFHQLYLLMRLKEPEQLAELEGFFPLTAIHELDKFQADGLFVGDREIVSRPNRRIDRGLSRRREWAKLCLLLRSAPPRRSNVSNTPAPAVGSFAAYRAAALLRRSKPIAVQRGRRASASSKIMRHKRCPSSASQPCASAQRRGTTPGTGIDAKGLRCSRLGRPLTDRGRFRIR